MATNMDHKKHCMSLHDMQFVDPVSPANRQLAFSIPLFESHFYSGRDERYFDLYNDVFTKPAVWSAMSILWNSDLGENGIKFYFHVEDAVYDFVAPYLSKCGVPEEYIRRVVLPEDYAYNTDVGHTQFGKKLMCFYDEALDVESVNIIDSDFFLCAKDSKAGLYRDLTSALLRDVISVYDFGYVRYNYCFYMKRIYYAAGLTLGELDNTGWINEGFDIWQSKNMLKPAKIEELCFNRYGFKFKIFENVDASNYVVRPFVSANLLQIPMRHDFVDVFKEFGHQCYHEEGLLGLYFLANDINPMNLSQVLGVPRFIFEEEFQPVDTYFAHYVDAKPDFNKECYSDFFLAMLQMYNNIYEK